MRDDLPEHILRQLVAQCREIAALRPDDEIAAEVLQIATDIEQMFWIDCPPMEMRSVSR